MVTEIRRRASNQSTEAASCAIVRFLEIDNCEESSNGWMLLSTLNLLAAGPPQLIEVSAALRHFWWCELLKRLFTVPYLLPELEQMSTNLFQVQEVDCVVNVCKCI